MKPTLRRSLVGSAVLIALYGAGGALVVPNLTRQALQTYAANHHYAVRVGAIRCNPYTLALDLGPVTFTGGQGEATLSIARAQLNLGWTTLLGRSVDLKELDIQVDRARASLRADGSVNLFDLLPATDPTSPWPKIAIARAHLDARDVVYEQPSDGPAARVQIAHLTLASRAFSTHAPHTNWSLSIETNRHETARTEATLTLEPLGVSGLMQVDDFDLARLGPEWAGLLRTAEGRVSGHAQIHWSESKDPFNLSITDAQLQGGPLSVALPPEHGPVVNADHWLLDGLSYQGSTGALTIDHVALQSPHLSVQRNAKGWLGLSATGKSGGPFRMGSVSVQNGEVTVEDVAQAHPITTTVGAIQLQLDAPQDGVRPLSAQANLGASGHLEATGHVNLENGSATLAVKASRIAITDYNAYLEPHLNLRIDSALVSTAGEFERSQDAWHYTGEAVLDDVRTHDLVRQRDFLGLRHLQAEGLEVHGQDVAIHVHSMTADTPYAEVRIDANGKINLSSLLRDETEPAPSSAATVSIDTLHFANGRLYFADESQRPTFTAGIADLDGQIDGLSSDPSTRAHLSFSGHVDRYAPVAIEGDANFLGTPVAADVRMHFENLELTGLSPYAGRFAGYRIRKGKATADLTYHVAAKRVNATHHIRLKQFELGDRVEGQGDFGVPLRLVVALLKDKDGNIDLDVPLTGSFSDPDFHLGEMTRKVVGNLFRKVASAPFAFLGALFGAGEEISLIDFSAGSADLNASARERISTLARALQARPQINIEIPISIAQVDATALADQRYASALLKRARERLGDADDATLSSRLEQSSEDRRSVLVALLGNEATPGAETAQLEVRARQLTTPTADDLEQLARSRAEAIQSTLVDGTGVDPSRVFLVRGASADTSGNAVHLKLALR